VRSWLRLVRTFDPATLVAVVVAGLLPTALILAISSFALTGMSIELGDLLEEPHLERVRTQAQLLSAEIDARLEAWRGALREVVSSRGEATPPPDRGGGTPLPRLDPEPSAGGALPRTG